MLFAVRYGYLEYYYINDPVQGKTANLTVGGGTHRVSTPILGDLYSYHVFPMLVIFILVGFGPFFDSHSFNILGRHERRKSASLGVASVISAILVEDFAWFFFRWGLPLNNDPKRGMLMQVGLDNTHNIGGLTILSHLHLVVVLLYHIGILLRALLQVSSFTMRSRNQKKANSFS